MAKFKCPKCGDMVAHSDEASHFVSNHSDVMFMGVHPSGTVLRLYAGDSITTEEGIEFVAHGTFSCTPSCDRTIIATKPVSK